jgi:hypothetical protein
MIIVGVTGAPRQRESRSLGSSGCAAAVGPAPTERPDLGIGLVAAKSQWLMLDCLPSRTAAARRPIKAMRHRPQWS